MKSKKDIIKIEKLEKKKKHKPKNTIKKTTIEPKKNARDITDEILESSGLMFDIPKNPKGKKEKPLKVTDLLSAIYGEHYDSNSDSEIDFKSEFGLKHMFFPEKDVAGNNNIKPGYINIEFLQSSIKSKFN